MAGGAYVICPICNFFDNIYNKVFKFIKNEKKKKKSLSNNLRCVYRASYSNSVHIFYDYCYYSNLVNSVVRLIQIIPDNVNKVIDFVQKFLNENETLMKYSENIIDKTYTFINDWLGNEFLGYAQGIASGVSTGVVNIIVVLFNVLIGFIVATYLLTARKKLAKQGEMVVYSIFKKERLPALWKRLSILIRCSAALLMAKSLMPL